MPDSHCDKSVTKRCLWSILRGYERHDSLWLKRPLDLSARHHIGVYWLSASVWLLESATSKILMGGPSSDSRRVDGRWL